MKIYAVITTYKPNKNEIYRNLNSISKQVDKVIVVDNTPRKFKFKNEYLSKNIFIISDGINYGLARALNIGIKKAIEETVDFVVLFDQDSLITDGMVNQLRQSYLDLFNKYKIAGIGELVYNIDTKEMYKRKIKRGLKIDNKHIIVTQFQTSGLFIPIQVFQKTGLFNEKLFLDLVDFDWCWKAAYNNYKIAINTKAKLGHRLGKEGKKFVFIDYNIPVSFRHYYQFRDSLFMIFSKYTPPYQKLRLSILLLLKFFIYPFLLDEGLKRFNYMLLGIKDFFANKRGIGSLENLLGE